MSTAWSGLLEEILYAQPVLFASTVCSSRVCGTQAEVAVVADPDGTIVQRLTLHNVVSIELEPPRAHALCWLALFD